MKRTLALLSSLAMLAAAPAAAAPAPAAFAARLDAAREAYLATVEAPVRAADWDARYRTFAWFWEPPVPARLAAYEALVHEVGRSATARDPGDPYFKRKGVWVRPYAADASGMRVLEVMDRIQALGATEVYLETFYGGRVAYGASRAFPARYPGLDVVKAYAREARHRGLKLYAWVHTLRWSSFGEADGLGEPVADGWGRATPAAEGQGAGFVSPSAPAVRARLGALFDEVAGMGCFDGMWLDYMRYPLGSRGATNQPDPRDYWGYGPAARQALRREHPELATPDFERFLATGEAPDEGTRAAWMGAWRRFLAGELRDVVILARTKAAGRLKLGVAFHPGAYLRPHDARAQEALSWLPHLDEACAMCYAYDPDVDPAEAAQARGTIDRELAVVEAGVEALHGARRPEVLASLAAHPPGEPGLGGRRHWPILAQMAYLKGRRVEGAFPSLDGVALFSYGWLWPGSDAARRVGEAEGAAGRAAPPPL